MGVPENLKEIRNRRNLSQIQLSIKSGVSQSAISAIERGIRVPSIETLLLLAQVLNVPVSEIAGDEKEKPAASESDRIKDDIIFALNNLRKEDLYHLHEYAEFLVSRDKK